MKRKTKKDRQQSKKLLNFVSTFFPKFLSSFCSHFTHIPNPQPTKHQLSQTPQTNNSQVSEFPHNNTPLLNFRTTRASYPHGTDGLPSSTRFPFPFPQTHDSSESTSQTVCSERKKKITRTSINTIHAERLEGKR